MKMIFKYIFASTVLLFTASALSFGQNGEEADTYMGAFLTPDGKTTDGDDKYILTLESYLKGKVVEKDTVKHVATDFALVLDMSSSMLSTYVKVGSDINALDKEIGALDAMKYNCPDVPSAKYNTRAYRLNGKNGTNIHYNGSNWVDDNNKVITSGNFYITNFHAMLIGVKEFVKSVYDDATADLDGDGKADNVNHRISITVFNADTSLDDFKNYGSTETLLGLTSIINGIDAINATVNSLDDANSSGFAKYIGRGTHSDLGMALGYETLKNSNAQNKIAVMFTDGEPTSPMTDKDSNKISDLSRRIINGCIDAAKDIKDLEGGKVFVVALGSYKDAAENYMQYTSSNYPDATEYSKPGTKDDEGNYFGQTADPNALANLFVQIAKEAVGSASATVTAENSYTKGVVSQSFVIPEDTPLTDVKLYTCVATSVNNSGVPTWATSGSGGVIRYRDAKGNVYTENASGRTAEYWVPWTPPTDITDPIVIDGNNLIVKGFDYSGHWVGKKQTSDTHEMQKLIVQIPVVTAENAVGGPDVVVLDPDTSGLYLIEDDELLANYNDVKSDVPTKIKVTVSGLKPGESVIIKLSQSDKPDSDWEPYNTIILTGDEDGNASATVKTGLVKYFKLDVDNAWSWTYDTKTDGDTVTTYGIDVNPFEYESTKNGVKVLNAENEVRNDFGAGTHTPARK